MNRKQRRRELRLLRISRDLFTQEAAAEAASKFLRETRMTPRRYWVLENSLDAPKRHELLALARAFRVPKSELAAVFGIERSTVESAAR